MNSLGHPSAGTRAVALALAVLIFALGAVPAAGGPGAYIKFAAIDAVDQDSDGLIDYLNVSVRVEPPADGAYTVSVVLRWPTTGTTLASAGTTGLLSSLGHTLTFRLDGPTIREKQLDGPYNLTVTLLSSPSGPVSDSAFFPTSPYHYTDFEASGGEEKPKLNVGQEEISVSSHGINATVNLTSPSIRWGRNGQALLTGTYEARFTHFVVLTDANSDAMLDILDPVECSASLSAVPWSISALEIGPDTGLGSFIRFTLANAVRFTGSGCAATVNATATLSFLIAQKNGTVGDPLPYQLAGGYEVKVDIEVDVQGSLPGNMMAVEADLIDHSANSTFLVRKETGYEEWAPTATNNQPIVPLNPAVPADQERVSFVDGGGTPVAHFAWVTLATQRLASGQERFAHVSASAGLQPSERALRLMLVVPYSPEVRTVLFDPAVGMSPQPTAPGGPGGTPPPPPSEPPSLTVFIASIAAFSAIFFFTVYARAKKY